MSARFLGVVGFVLISLGCASQVSADWFFGIFDSIARDTKRRQCWPQPFTAPDRAAVRTPFATMVSNGWRRQNMLGEFHFEPRTGQLTEAGRLKVRWILTVAPEQHRLIYVHTADTNEETTARMAAVVQLASQIAPNAPSPVLPTSISDEGWSASEVDAISKKYIGATPNPRLPMPSTSGGATGSGGGAGGGGSN
jgi:hypothetical protein